MKILDQLKSFECGGDSIEYLSSSSNGYNINFPQYQQPLYTQTYTTTSINSQNEDYMVFPLPEEKGLQAVFVNGRMVTLGILGSDAECCFANKSIIMDRSVLGIMYNSKATLILEYKDHYYHYSLGSFINIEGNTRTPKHKLLSKVKKG